MNDSAKSKEQLIAKLQVSQERIASLEAELAALQEQLIGDLSSQDRESEIEMAAIFAAMSDVVLVLDGEGRYLEVAPTNPDLLYKPSENVVGKTLHELFPKEVADQFFGYVRQALETRKPVHFDYPLPIKDQVLWFDATVTRMHDNAVVLVSRDVTANRQAAQQLQLQNLMLEVAANGITMTDRQGHIIWANRALSELTGYSRDELVGKTPRILKSGVHDAAFYTDMWQTILAGNVWQGDIVNRRKDGSLYYEEMTITPVKDENDKISHFIAIKQDVTERKEAEQALETAYADLEKQVEARTAELVTANTQLEKRIHDLDVVQEGSRSIAASLDLEEFLVALHKIVRMLVPADNFYVALYDQVENAWHIPYLFDQGSRKPPARYEVGMGLTSHIIHTKKPLLLRTPQELFAFHETQGLQRVGGRSKCWMGVPLLTGDKLVGVMGVQDYEHPNTYSDADLSIFLMLASQAAISLENARLFEAQQRANLESARRAVQLSTAAEVSRSASSILDLDVLLPQVVQLIKDRFDLYYAGIFLVDRQRKRALLRAGTGNAGRIMLERQHSFELESPSMIAACIQKGEPRIALDVGEEAVRFNNPLLPETRSEMALPLISRDQVIGAMTFQDSRSEAFSDEDITALQTMADQLANTITNAQLFTQTQASLAETEALYNAITELGTVRSLDDMLVNVMAQIPTADINQATLLLVEPDPKTGTQCLVSQANWHSDLGVDPMPLGTRITTAVFDFGRDQDAHEPIFVDDIEHNVQLGADVKKLLLQRGIMAIAFFPLWAAAQQLGMLMLAVRQVHWFPEREVQFYTALAGQMAVAIERQQLFAATERRARREQLLREITESVRGSMNPEVIMRTAVRELGHALGRPAFAHLGSKENLLQAVSLSENGQVDDEVVSGDEQNE